ncbi:MAG: hypothetical protein KAI94_11175, partial [Anaerolineales bacterium]|nr:hypothetical protein [Anaerolineales bacterium]
DGFFPHQVRFVDVVYTYHLLGHRSYRGLWMSVLSRFLASVAASLQQGKRRCSNAVDEQQRQETLKTGFW